MGQASRLSLLCALAWACLLLGGLAIRIPHLADPPLEFHPTRQYRAAVIARGYLAPNLVGFTRSELHAAQVSAARLGPIEPPVFEHVAAIVERLAGAENLWIPRLIGVLAWAAGAAAIWWLVAPASGALAGLAAVAVFLFLPYGVPASQAFQPDGALTVLIAAALAALLHDDRRRTHLTAVVVLLLASAAVFVKPMALFFLVPVALVLATTRLGAIKGVARVAAWTVIAAIPAGAWYVYVAFVSPRMFEDRFFPQLLVRAVFWTDWLRMLNRVVTWPLLLLAFAGTVLATGVTRRALVALWVGYLAFGLLFTHHIHTHDYYSLPVFVLVAWSVGALVSRAQHASASVGQASRLSSVASRLSSVASRLSSVASRLSVPHDSVPPDSVGQASRLSLPLVLVLLVLSVAWAWRHPPYPHDPESNAWAARYERIGLDVNHSDRVISLDGHYGFPLSYHGRLVASNWPLSIDMAVSTLAGRSTAPAAESRLAATGGEFFVATLQSELDAQPDLGALLNERYPVIDRDGTPDHWNYVVYDLRRTRVSVTPSAVSAFGRVADPSHLAHTVHLWAAPGAKWRIAIPRPDLLDVSPTEGTGPAVLTVVPRRLSASVDVRLDVAILGGGDVPSGSFTVRVRTVPAGARVAPFGFVDAPADPVTPTDAPIVFQGWALDDLSVRRVWVELGDRRLAGHSVRMLAETVPGDLRPDVATAYPNASDVFHSAWALTLPPDVVRALPRPAVLHFFAEDSDGLRAELGMRTIR